MSDWYEMEQVFKDIHLRLHDHGVHFHHCEQVLKDIFCDDDDHAYFHHVYEDFEDNHYHHLILHYVNHYRLILHCFQVVRDSLSCGHAYFHHVS